MKVIKFDRDYSKLNNNNFTSIRDHDKHIFNNQIVIIKSPTKEFKAKCISWGRVKFSNIPKNVFINDLEFSPVFTRESLFVHEQALRIIKEIYPNLNLDSFVYLYNFKKV